MGLSGRSLISLSDLTLDEIVAVLDCAERMAEAVGFDDPSTRGPAEALDRVLATCFFEPSTRTRMSFASAMLRLGGQVVDFGGVEASSVAKGETLADTARVISGYCDIMAQRHPLAGSAKVAAMYGSVPVINAGDGAREHPTQTLTDLFWIRRQHGTLSGLRVGLCGDLLHGRTVHSLAPVLAELGSMIVCIAPDGLRMPEEVLARCARASGRRPDETVDLAQALAEMRLDALYMTRVQAERFEDRAEYERLRGAYMLTAELMRLAPADMIVLHPLPRVDEIAPEVDADKRAQYFGQAAGGVPVRMALLSLILGLERPDRRKAAQTQACAARGAASLPRPREEVADGMHCANPRCVTSTERYLPALAHRMVGGEATCAFCEQAMVAD